MKQLSFLFITVLFFQFTSGVTLGGDMYKKTIMIDLDGVLYEYTCYTEEIPEIKSGAKDFLKNLSEEYKLVLFTTRDSDLSRNWLEKNKIDKYFQDVTNVKKPAYIYLDDRAIKFEGNYKETLNQIQNFKVYWNE